jgi:hypothetical protein
MARRTVPPKSNRTTTEQLEDLFRRLGKPDPSLLAALLDGVSEQQFRDRAQAAPETTELLARTVTEVGKGFDHWQKLTLEQRKKLRGCSMALFAVAVDQARQLTQLHAQHLRQVAEHEQAQVREQKLLQEAQHVCTQTKGLLLKVAGGRPSIQLALNEKLADASSPYAMINNLKYLADASRSLIQLPAPAVRGRATLYGMDRNFIDSLTGLAEEIRAEDEKVSARPSRLPVRDTMSRARAVLWSMLNHIADVFASAHAIDSTTPLVRPPASGANSGVMPAHKAPEPLTDVEAAKRKASPQTLHIPRLR